MHSKLDDDADGEVDDVESKKFLQSDRHGADKLSYLHRHDDDRRLSVEELLEAWKRSQVHNWTTDETVYWLVNYVELPEYSSIFEQNSINGTLLPTLATDSHFISKLGITEQSAKKKISIKAMDVVLFGPPKLGNSKIRDILLTVLIVIGIPTCYVFYSRSRASHKALQALQTHVESLQRAEDHMQSLQEELNKAKKAQEAVVTEKKNLEHQLEMQRQFSATSLSDHSANNNASAKLDCDSTSSVQNADNDLYISKLENELKTLKDELDKTYDAMAEKKFRAPFPLRNLLKLTYNIESQYYNEKKLNLETKATEMKIRNQKLQKKKTSFLGYYKMAQENSLEEDINTIVEVKEAIMQVSREIKERTERWRAIEEHCGCSLDLRHSESREQF